MPTAMDLPTPLPESERAAPRHAEVLARFELPGLTDPDVLERALEDAASIDAQAHRWADIIDDVEAFAAEIMREEPPYDWGDNPPDFALAPERGEDSEACPARG